MRVWADAAADLLLGAACPGCGVPGLGCCPACRAALEEEPVRHWRSLWPRGSPEPVLAAAPYAGVVRQLVTAYKERQAWSLAGLLGPRLGLAVAALLEERGWDGPVLLVPVPSSPAVVRERGLDTTARLASRAAGWLRGAGLPVRSGPRLAHRRRVGDQAELSAAERWENLSGALAARAGPRSGEAWVVVDDVVTTGASLAEARRASADVGAHVLGGAVVAATERRPEVPGQ
ncbi:ComF family protein [Auraticoccus monumenti]|uniref:Predicted amidophosphoribosyltransferases n=1 Tax=Auraticoccus monumenti TaxID=675864 RepID=A0A1G7E2I2_9ACTN|nr:ComF family protein [Auraticoccus monumenti]SDE57914.1 Predicted amidophosphoribosyltransferases [Auraticoccus monumenti]